MARKLKSFIDGFIKYTEGRGSPELYRRWTAIFLISAAIERKGWMLTNRGKWYPNQYIVLVGPAGVGKSLCTEEAFTLLDEIRTPENPLHIAPTSITRAALADHLNEAERRIVRLNESPPITSFNSLIVVANELGVFLPAWESEFMSTLTDVWDNKRFAESRRHNKDRINIPNAQLNIFSATTPSHLNRLLPEGAWEEGFMSRVLLIFSDDTAFQDLWTVRDDDKELRDKLKHDLADIYKIWGEFVVSDETKEAINEWARQGGPPIPDHPKLMTYRTRRIGHLLKLCVIASASVDSERIITLDSYSEALDWLVEAESFMPDIFKSLRTGGDARAIEECWHFCYLQWMKHKEPIPEHLIIAFLQERVPAHSVDKILDVMTRAQLLKKQFLKSGGSGYEPKVKTAG